MTENKIYKRSDRMQARLDASKAGLDELKLLKQKYQASIDEAKTRPESSRRHRLSFEPGLPQAEEIKPVAASVLLSSNVARFSDRRYSLDISSLPSVTKRFSISERPEEVVGLNEKKYCREKSDSISDKPSSSDGARKDMRRSSVCLGADLSKLHPSAHARSFTLSGCRFEYPSPLHAVFLENERKVLNDDTVVKTSEDIFDKNTYFLQALADILSQKVSNVKPDEIHSKSILRHSMSSLTEHTAKLSEVRALPQTENAKSQNSSDMSLGDGEKLLVPPPRRKRSKPWFETELDAPLEIDELKCIQNDNICDNKNIQSVSPVSKFQIKAVNVIDHAPYDCFNETERQRSDSPPTYSRDNSNVMSLKGDLTTNGNRLSYLSEDSGAISGSCISLLTNSSACSTPSLPHFPSDRRLKLLSSSSEEGYYSEQYNTPRGRLSLNTDDSFSSDNMYLAEDELSEEDHSPLSKDFRCEPTRKISTVKAPVFRRIEGTDGAPILPPRQISKKDQGLNLNRSYHGKDISNLTASNTRNQIINNNNSSRHQPILGVGLSCSARRRRILKPSDLEMMQDTYV